MKNNKAFSMVLFVFLLLVVYGLCVMIAGMDSYRNRSLMEDRSIGANIVSYLFQ